MANTEYYNIIIVNTHYSLLWQLKGSGNNLLKQSLSTAPDVTHTWPNYTVQPINSQDRRACDSLYVCKPRGPVPIIGHRSVQHSHTARLTTRTKVHQPNALVVCAYIDKGGTSLTRPTRKMTSLWRRLPIPSRLLARSSARYNNSHNDTIRLVLTNYINIYIMVTEKGICRVTPRYIYRQPFDLIHNNISIAIYTNKTPQY
jgi:hypothetical protein